MKPVLRTASKKDAKKWIKRARRTSVRKLRRAIKEKTRETPEPADETMISFEAPPEVHLAFAKVEELGRMQLGSNGSRAEIIWAILAETGFGGIGGEPEEVAAKRPEPKVRRIEWVEHLVAQSLKMDVNALRKMVWSNFAAIMHSTGALDLLPESFKEIISALDSF